MNGPRAASPADSEELDEDALNDLSIPVRAGQYDARKSSEAEGRPSADADDAEASLLEKEGNETRPKRPRAASFARFSFDLGRQIMSIPLSVDVEPGGLRAERSLGLLSGSALVIGGQIGSGIFSTPGLIVSDVGSVGCSLLVWICAGALSWTGAATFAELGAAIPLNGGMQAYLNYSYGPLVAYLFLWVSVTGSTPGTTAAIALATSEYMCRILYHTAYKAEAEESAKNIPTIVIKLVALVFLGLSAFFVAIGNRVSYRIQTVLTIIKLMSLLTVTILGIVQAARGMASSSLRHDIFTDSSRSPGAYAIAIYSALFSYSGWDYICNVAGEMSDAPRDLPRVVHVSMGTTMTLYVLANVSYFVVLEKQSVGHSNTVGLDFGKALFGPLGGVLLALAIALSSFGAMHSAMAALSRLYSVAAQEGYLPARIGEIHPRLKTPLNATLVYTLATAIYLLVGSYKTLITTFGICNTMFYFLSATSLLVLRVREPLLERPYRTFVGWPLIFCGVSIFLVLMPIVAAPVQFFAAAGITLSGLPGYYIIRKRGKLSFEKLYSALPTFGGSKRSRRRETSNGSLHVSKSPELQRISEEPDFEDDEHVPLESIRT